MGRRINLHLLLLFVAVFPQWSGASVIWTDIATPAVESKNTADPYRKARRILADMDALAVALFAAPLETDGNAARSATAATQIELPMPDGSMRAFYVIESPIMEHELARKFPQIKTYKVRSVEDMGVSGRLGLGPTGFYAYLHTNEGVVYIDPVRPLGSDQYYSFYKQDYAASTAREFSCGARRERTDSPVEELKSLFESRTLARTSNELLTYRLAVATTGEYSIAVAGGNAANTLAEVVNAINRVNEIYERDLAIRLELIANNDQIIYTNASSDPYTNNNASALLIENQQNLDTEDIPGPPVIGGPSAYDIGHVFSTGGGGLAAFEVVCVNGGKAQGETGASNPTGDPFYIDFVAHEIGHQFGADHTFNGTTNSCGGLNRNASTAFEPGSGSTIMSYAGICGAENVAAVADATFHAGSIAQILAYSRTGAGNGCAVTTTTGNTAPVADAGADYTIPARTAFTLTGSATDVDMDTLAYQWDQMDAGTATTIATYGTDLGTNALFRTFEPVVSDPVRTFPRMSDLLAGMVDEAETLPATNRDLNFRFTVRDIVAINNGNGGVDEDDVLLTVDGNSGPFRVLQPNTAITLETTQPQVIEWNSACTELAPVNCTNVDIELSTDGFVSSTTLVSGTPNDGAESVNIPLSTSSSARIRVACTGNIFFDISDADFSLVQDGSGSTLILTGNGGSSNCNVPIDPVVGDPNSLDQEPNDTTGLAVSITPPVTINGTVNSITDFLDYFSFVSSGGAYTFVLSDYGSNDLDLILLDGTGSNIIQESASISGTTETVSVGLVAGQTYYIVVNGWETFGLDSDYTLTITTTPSAPASDDGGSSSVWLLLAMLAMLGLGRLQQNRRSELV